MRVVGENEDISPQPSVLRTTSVLEVAILQASKAIVGTSTDVPLASRITMDILSVLLLEETLLRSEDIQQSGKKKTLADDKGEMAVPRKSTEGDGGSGDSRKTKRDREAPS
ncbi:hypothetical protein Fot_25048 [Forsythia ovata]|uniref:Uncharacterized protein n=1 Tax=Forsythia ovata TaxID=205694 RepID=A0ABD1U811_9LAMI